MINRLAIIVVLIGVVSATVVGKQLTAIERKLGRTTNRQNTFIRRDINPPHLYPAYTISVPVDHFQNDSLYEPHSDDAFELRYWFDAEFYKPGGPVIVLQSGETDGVDRLPFLQKGILHKLALSTNGIGVVLEHRYYGESFPVPDLTTKNLRFLTTDQALADTAYFARNVVFPGLEEFDLTVPNVAYIGYGGSYAGAFNAFLRKLYPDVFWGVIASSGVVEAIHDYWQYFEPIRVYAEPTCVLYTQKITHMMDNILIGLNKTATTAQLKAAFNLPNVTYDDDFAYEVASGIDSWQGRVWDPALNDPTFDSFCGAITNDSMLYPRTSNKTSTVQDLLKIGGYGHEVAKLTMPLLNWIGWLTEHNIDFCSGTQDSCFSTHIPSFYRQTSIRNGWWRAWPYQYCSQWGYFYTGSGVPLDQLPLISRTNNLEHSSIVCKEAFNITTPPNVDAVNKYGGFNLSYPRLAYIDGEQDPWRPATPHASPFNRSVVNRTNSISEPFVLIKGGVHHWDEYGLFENETFDGEPNKLPPAEVGRAYTEELNAVHEWLEEWKQRSREEEKHDEGILKNDIGEDGAKWRVDLR